MRYLTKYWYNKMQKGVMNLNKEENEWFDLIDRLYLEETESFAYPLHDGVLINFQKINNNYELVVYVDIDDENIKTKFVKITFSNAAILEFEFKGNVFLVDHVGEYISALSNSAAMLGRKYGYLIWGVNDKTHEVIGTNIDYNKSINNEPIKHYLARKLNPSI